MALVCTWTSMNGAEPPFERRSMNGEEPPFKRRRVNFLMLPDDLVLNCLARISRLYYPSLSLVSKRFGSILTSMELYQTQTLLGRTESCLYVCLRQSTCAPISWFTLCRKPNSSKRLLAPISYPKSASRSDCVVGVGPNIYAIGGFSNDNEYSPSSSVMVMDCRTHTWGEAPRMQVARVFQSTCVFDGKIYVIGGRGTLDSTKWMEVFDTKTQTWEFLQFPSEEKICEGYKYESIVYEGTVYVRSHDQNVTYKLHKGRWIEADLAMNNGWSCSSSFCVIENVFYCCNRNGNGMIDWYDSEKKVWATLKGLKRLPKLYGNVKLADYGGKMMVLWKRVSYVMTRKKTKIWCAEITIEKRKDGEIWGILEWFDVVYKANVDELHLEHALVTTI
ncbi:F-box/kelch-repeat protein At4g23580 [Arabidopsis lyrata subsp. lyrata]|nr:F-box/kelch-repeat protein At4g23580 [Arabidopsis lyrata subsp. lyrata]|eukprot:XP_020873539.1 F-box/kelch-repeat protein At4g23580 [Arabidopsis lyrata subsp. lyrata]